MYENLLKMGNRRVLVIDDEEFTLSALESILRILKVNVDESVDFAMSGKEALELVKKLQTHNIRYCLILTDIQMPGLNGIETA
jgi:CheY-like chemotaxis protein